MTGQSYFTHPAYESSLSQAVDRARREPSECVSVYYDGTSMFVRLSSVEKPPNSKLICIAQRWDDKTVQLRFDGAWSEWR